MQVGNHVHLQAIGQLPVFWNCAGQLVDVQPQFLHDSTAAILPVGATAGVRPLGGVMLQEKWTGLTIWTLPTQFDTLKVIVHVVSIHVFT